MKLKAMNIKIQVVVITIADFLADSHARRYADVINDPRIDFAAWLRFFSDPLRQQRLQDAERHFGRPALAGVVQELEAHGAFRVLIRDRDGTKRHRQTIGVIVKLIMRELGWKTTGKKGFLGGGRKNGFSKVFFRRSRTLRHLR